MKDWNSVTLIYGRPWIMRTEEIPGGWNIQAGRNDVGCSSPQTAEEKTTPGTRLVGKGLLEIGARPCARRLTQSNLAEGLWNRPGLKQPDASFISGPFHIDGVVHRSFHLLYEVCQREGFIGERRLVLFASGYRRVVHRIGRRLPRGEFWNDVSFKHVR